MARIAFTAVATLVLSVTIACSTHDGDPAPDSGITYTAPDASHDGSMGDAGPPPGGPGSACTSDADCDGDEPFCLTDDGFRNGYCVTFCFPDVADCPDGTYCTQLAFMSHACLVVCDPTEENPCRLGFGCGEGAGDQATCAPGCDVDADCPEGLRCNRDDGVLSQGECYDPEAALTDPCTEPEQCNEDSWCIRERDRGWPGGACTVFGCDETDDTGCPGDAHCVFDFYRDPICVDGCEVDSDCRAGYACAPDETYPERVRCTPRCEVDAHCLEAGHRCDVGTGRCVG